MKKFFSQKLALKKEINNIDYDSYKKHTEKLKEKIEIKNMDGDSFHLKFENVFKISKGYLKSISLPARIPVEDFQNQYYLDPDMEEVFKSQEISAELFELLRTHKIIYISQIFISPKYRNKGLGSKLVQEFHSTIKEFYKNERVVIVLTASPLGKVSQKEMSFKENTSGLNRFYSRLGYTDIRGSIVKYIEL